MLMIVSFLSLLLSLFVSDLSDLQRKHTKFSSGKRKLTHDTVNRIASHCWMFVWVQYGWIELFVSRERWLMRWWEFEKAQLKKTTAVNDALCFGLYFTSASLLIASARGETVGGRTDGFEGGVPIGCFRLSSWASERAAMIAAMAMIDWLMKRYPQQMARVPYTSSSCVILHCDSVFCCCILHSVLY